MTRIPLFVNACFILLEIILSLKFKKKVGVGAGAELGKKRRAFMETAGVSSRVLRFCSDVSQMKRNYKYLKVKSLQDGIRKLNSGQFMNYLRGAGTYMPYWSAGLFNPISASQPAK